MQVNTLGALKAVIADTDILLRAGQQRIVLALLAMYPGKPVSIDKIARALWGDGLPESWPVSVRGLVKRLRHALGDSDHTIISSPMDGYYSLNVVKDDVDALKFKRLLKEGCALLETGRFGEAHATLNLAEDLWRGEPFEDVPSDWLHAEEGLPLERELIEAKIGRLDAAVRLSIRLSIQAVPELEHLVAHYPNRASLRQTHMLALYRSDRYPEAVQAYRDWWDYLRDGAGARPGPKIKFLAKLIHEQDDTLFGEPLGFDRLP